MNAVRVGTHAHAVLRHLVEIQLGPHRLTFRMVNPNLCSTISVCRPPTLQNAVWLERPCLRVSRRLLRQCQHWLRRQCREHPFPAVPPPRRCVPSSPRTDPQPGKHDVARACTTLPCPRGFSNALRHPAISYASSQRCIPPKSSAHLLRPAKSDTKCRSNGRTRVEIVLRAILRRPRRSASRAR